MKERINYYLQRLGIIPKRKCLARKYNGAVFAYCPLCKGHPGEHDFTYRREK